MACQIHTHTHKILFKQIVKRKKLLFQNKYIDERTKRKNKIKEREGDKEEVEEKKNLGNYAHIVLISCNKLTITWAYLLNIYKIRPSVYL